MNIHVADRAGDATEFAELSAEKSPLCVETHKYTCAVQYTRMLGLSPFVVLSDPPACERPGVHSCLRGLAGGQ